MGTLYTILCIVIALLFLVVVFKLFKDENWRKYIGEKRYFSNKRDGLTLALMGITLLILTIIRVILASKLGIDSPAHWISAALGGIYGLGGIICLIYYETHKKTHKKTHMKTHKKTHKKTKKETLSEKKEDATE